METHNNFKINQWMNGNNLFTIKQDGTIIIPNNLNGITNTQLTYLNNISSIVMFKHNEIINYHQIF